MGRLVPCTLAPGGMALGSAAGSVGLQCVGAKCVGAAHAYMIGHLHAPFRSTIALVPHLRRRRAHQVVFINCARPGNTILNPHKRSGRIAAASITIRDILQFIPPPSRREFSTRRMCDACGCVASEVCSNVNFSPVGASVTCHLRSGT